MLYNAGKTTKSELNGSLPQGRREQKVNSAKQKSQADGLKMSCAITNRDIDMSLTYENVGNLWKATIQFTIYPADLVPSMDVNIIYGTIHRNYLVSRDKLYW